MDEFYSLVQQLPTWLSLPLSSTPIALAMQIHELRFKAGAIPMVTRQGMQMAMNDLSVRTGFAMVPADGATLSTRFTAKQVEEVFYHLCGGSVHSYEEELRHGYFTLIGGHRVGVGGKYIRDATGWQIQTPLSLNIRIARHKTIALSPELATILSTRFTGFLILGEPDSGKTTLLRSFVLHMLAQNRTVVVIDEREELNVQGVDSISGMEKSDAVQLALRTLSPEVIVLDELGTLAELRALEQGFFGGVDFIATLHAASFAEAMQKPQFQYLYSHHMLRASCLLQGRAAPGEIQAIKQYETPNIQEYAHVLD